MSETNPPRITFPCADYPIKVVARAGDDLRARLDAVFVRHFGAFDVERVTVRGSAQQNFVSFTYLMHVHDPSQLAAAHAELMQEPGVVMVL